MQTRRYLRLCAVVVAVGAVFAATQGSAHNPTGVPITEPGPFVCTTTNFQIQAILGLSGEFPMDGGPCTLTPKHSGQNCVDYGYIISARSPTGPNVDHTVFAISADQDLDHTSPTSFVSVPGAGDNTTGFLKYADHEYAVRFNSSNTKSIEAHIFIVGPSSPRITSILVRSGTKNTESCLIAGPGVTVDPDPFQPLSVTETVLAAGGKCLVDLIYDAHGNLAEITPITSGCEVTIGDPTVNGEPLRNNTNRHGITFGNNTTTCYGPPVPSPARCVTCRCPTKCPC